LNSAEQKIIAHLNLDPKTPDSIAEETGIPVHEVSSSLTMLEIKKIARKMGGQGFVRVL
jgi:predicted Rossmann fold nucleotide-binding protein DprA/Smf involved in DNA uptake